jgi:hypothetical protein
MWLKIGNARQFRISTKFVEKCMEYRQMSVYGQPSFIVDHYGWKSDLLDTFGLKSLTSNFKCIYEKVYGLHGKVHVGAFVNRVSLWISMAEYWNFSTNFIGFELITALAMASFVFWDIMPCSSVTVNWHFGGTYRLHFQGRRVSQGSNQHEVGSKLACFTLRI